MKYLTIFPLCNHQSHCLNYKNKIRIPVIYLFTLFIEYGSFQNVARLPTSINFQIQELYWKIGTFNAKDF